MAQDWTNFINVRHPEQALGAVDVLSQASGGQHCIYGHMPYGLDRHIDQSVTYITFLRHPVERVLSAYDHNLRYPDEPGADVVRQMGLAWTTRPSNFMCRFLADYEFTQTPDAQGGYWAMHNPPDFVPASYLEQAKANLRRSSFIGLTETFAEDVQALSRLPGFKIAVPQTLPREKASKGRISGSDLTSVQWQGIAAANLLDMELYEYALELRAAWGGPIRPDSGAAETLDALASRGAERPSVRVRDLGGPAAPLIDWTPFEPGWVSLPGHLTCGPQPVRLSTPPTGFEYGAATGLLPAADVVLRLDLEVHANEVGIFVTGPDGVSHLSEERRVQAQHGPVSVYFRLSQKLAPALLVVRNPYDGIGAAVLSVSGAEYASEACLSEAERSALDGDGFMERRAPAEVAVSA